jgi:UDP-N-acetylmuramate--alanine ligase
MHLYFSAIGGAGIGPLALIARQAGYEVSGSDLQSSQFTEYLKSKGINVYIGDDLDNITRVNRKSPINWFVYSSAVTIENPKSPELMFCKANGIKTSKRDELLNYIIKDRKLKLIAIAGTHGKSTTTAMIIWVLKQLGIPISYSLGAKINFGETGEFNKTAEYFIYEADEFDRNFLSFDPFISVISGVSWDHHEIYPTRDDYKKAFTDFINKSHSVVLWNQDNTYLGLADSSRIIVENEDNIHISKITLEGIYNRLDAYLAIRTVHEITKTPVDILIQHINKFPGLKRRMEEIIPGLYSDYAHTPEKIRGAMSVANEMARKNRKDIVVVYEPLTDRRQHYIKRDYKDCFKGANAIYWLPSYLAREDPNKKLLSPEELIQNLDDPTIAKAMIRDDSLKARIDKHLLKGDMVIAMNGGGANGLDDWLRDEFI